MIEPIYLFWHRRDLRIFDNRALYEASKMTSNIIGLYIIDKNSSHTFGKCPAHDWFLYESLKSLKKSWEDLGSELIILKGSPVEKILLLSEVLKIDSIYS